MSPQKRRPQARKGRSVAAAARKQGRRNDRTLGLVAVVVLIVGVGLVFVLKPSNSSSGVKLGQHWHTALGVYACDHWDGGDTWPTPTNPSTNGPVRVNTLNYAGLHSHTDGLIHMEPETSDEIGDNANLGNYFKWNGFELSSTHVKFATADLTNGDKCGNAPGKLHWSVNGNVHTGDPNKYVLHDRDIVVVAFLPDSKKIASIGKPPSVVDLEKAEGLPVDSTTSTLPASAPATSTSTTAPPSTSTPTT